ncbi:MAG: ribonuclease D [Alphaproteobacteria bacterium]|nr:ribonuclease D [Alphaproteobacteria bacterium]MCB9931087.1 ribonuclease D [Alphaproteobacteria bacterium]
MTTLITDNAALAAFCASLADEAFVTVDTEFLRENTYYSKLCLIQIAGTERAAAIDTLAPGIELQPVYDLLANPDVLKVFHAARQDLEIFYHDMGGLPAPLFDTQVAAMVCGFGDSIAYDRLVAALTGEQVDKASRFTNWAHRPLSEAQIDYALGDVTHLRDVYTGLARRLEESGRADWLADEMAVLTDPGSYDADPMLAYLRLKSRTSKPKFLAVLQQVAAWREREAQTRNQPRNWVVRDDTLLNIAAQAPTTQQALSRVRGLGKGQAEGRLGREILEAVQAGLDLPADQRPRPRSPQPEGARATAAADLLKVLLKACCDREGVAPKLIASSSDLDRLSTGEREGMAALEGWRRDVFGQHALDLMEGRLALTYRDGEIAWLMADD